MNRKFVLQWPYLLIAILPILVFCATDALLHYLGDPVDVAPTYFAPFDAHREAAARLTTLGTFVLFIGAGVGAIAYFVVTVVRLERRSKYKVGAAMFLSLLAAGIAISEMDTRQMQDYLGPSLVCTALDYSPELSARGKDKDLSTGRVIVAGRSGGDSCRAARFRQLRWLLEGQKLMTMLGVAALVLGSICCLARPAAGEASDPLLAHYETQSKRLNTYLYLSALLLVTGLFFAAAYAKWPSYALLSRTDYDAHANSFVAYLGFSYTLLIASFYAPVAGLLALAIEPLKKTGDSQSRLPDAFEGPLQILKIVAAVFSTALAGALPAILNLGT